MWVPRDWALRPSYETRVAIINALYAAGENVQRLAPVMLAEAVRHDRRACMLGRCSATLLPNVCLAHPQLCACGAASLPSKACCDKALQLHHEGAAVRLRLGFLTHHAHAARMLVAWV